LHKYHTLRYHVTPRYIITCRSNPYRTYSNLCIPLITFTHSYLFTYAPCQRIHIHIHAWMHKYHIHTFECLHTDQTLANRSHIEESESVVPLRARMRVPLSACRLKYSRKVLTLTHENESGTNHPNVNESGTLCRIQEHECNKSYNPLFSNNSFLFTFPSICQKFNPSKATHQRRRHHDQALPRYP
jgi:hypothetical protein